MKNVFSYSILNLVLLMSVLTQVACNKNTEKEIEYTLNLGPDILLLDNDSLILDGGNDAISYKWSTGETSQQIVVDTIGVYWVEVKYPNLEVKSDTVKVDLLWRLARISTDFGDMLFWLYPQTPLHKNGFLDLVNSGFFDGKIFNRVINDFVIQGGCPDLPGGFTDTSLFINAEFRSELKHIPGALGGGRDENPLWKTNICQFYIVDKSAPNLTYLDMKYTIFGHVIDGLNIVDSISNLATNSQDQPLKDVMFDIEELTLTGEQLFNQFGFEIN